MLGNTSHPGVFYQALHQILSLIITPPDSNQPPPSFNLSLNLLIYALYNNKIFDLGSNSESGSPVKSMRAVKGFRVADLSDASKAIQNARKYMVRIGGELAENNFEGRAHFILELVVRNRSGNVVGTLKFVRMVGSENAGKSVKGSAWSKQEEKFKKFVTDSFNAVSTNLLLSALKKGEKENKKKFKLASSKLTDCLSESFKNDKIIVVTSVSSIQSEFMHSLPALKFCSRIRDCVTQQLFYNRNKLKEIEPKKGKFRSFRIVVEEEYVMQRENVNEDEIEDSDERESDEELKESDNEEDEELKEFVPLQNKLEKLRTEMEVTFGLEKKFISRILRLNHQKDKKHKNLEKYDHKNLVKIRKKQ